MNQNKIILDHIRKHLLDIVANEDPKSMDPEGLLVEIAVERLPVWINEIDAAQTDTDTISRKAVIDAIDEWKEACAGSGHKETVSDIKLIRKDFIELPPVTPKQRTGKWKLDRSGAYCCSECMEPCASYVMMKPRDKFCKMCGSRNEVTE